MDHLDRLGINGILSRRDLLRQGAQLGVATGAIGFLAACGDDDDDAASTTTGASKNLTGDVKFLNYPDWIGAGEYAAFKKLHPGVSIKEDSSGAGSTSAIATRIQSDPHAFDFLLLGKAGVPQLVASDIVADIDWEQIPNISNMPERFRKAYPWGIPTDYGKIGYAYRKDLVSERPETWNDFFDLAPKYSKKVILLDVLEDTIGNTLISLGYDGNTRDESQVNEARDKLISIKPHVQAILASDVAKPLTTGAAVIGMDWDFDIALAKQKEPNIEWVVPPEGVMAYIEGWVGVKTSEHLDVVHSFMNFHLQPRMYADFVNSTGTAFLMPAAAKYVKKEIRDDPILAFDDVIFDRVTFEEFKGEALGTWTQAWNEVKSA